MPGKPKRPSSSKAQPPKKHKPNPRPPQPKKTWYNADLIQIKLTDIANGGYALGLHQKRPVFVPYSIPGETVEARITRRDEKVMFAEGVRLLVSSGDRITPQCQHFGPGRCRNCQWQHMNYPAQLLLKHDILADQLGRVGKFPDAVLAPVLKRTLPAAQLWGYQHQTTLERMADGGLGFMRTDGQSIEPLVLCHTLHPDLQALYETLDIDFPEMRRITLQRGSDGATMLLLEMTTENVPELAADFATSVNVLLPNNEPANLIGDTAVQYVVGERPFRVTAGSFFRANVPQINTLISEVLKVLPLTNRAKVLDLYAGVGVFSAFLAARVSLVTLVESYPPAVSDADVNLAAFENVDVVEGAVEEVLLSLIEAQVKYEAAIVDPPGSGMSQAALAALLQLAPHSIVYIGSNPASLARDCQHFAKNGYQVRHIQPIDFAPQTYYVETIVLMQKA
jgi:23S rRNA (uracil1939-C5)-methyltransferase